MFATAFPNRYPLHRWVLVGMVLLCSGCQHWMAFPPSGGFLGHTPMPSAPDAAIINLGYCETNWTPLQPDFIVETTVEEAPAAAEEITLPAEAPGLHVLPPLNEEPAGSATDPSARRTESADEGSAAVLPSPKIVLPAHKHRVLDAVAR